MTEVERICVSFRDQSADWSWESVIPLYQGRGERIATPVNRSLVRNDRVFARSAVQVRRRGEGTPPYGTVCRGGRPCPPGLDNATPCRAGPVCPAVGAEKILVGPSRTPAPTDGLQEVRRGGALPLPRATARVAPTDGLQEVQWAGDRKGRPYESVTRGAMGGRPQGSPLQKRHNGRRKRIPQSRLRRASPL